MTIKTLAIPLAQRIWFGAHGDECDYHQPVKWAAEGNRVVAELLASGEPCMVTRLGSQEVGCVSYYLRWREGRRFRPGYPAAIRRGMSVNAGVFPANDAHLDEFARRYLQTVKQADVMAVWFNRAGSEGGQRRVVNDYCEHARLVELAATLGILYPAPWSAQLAGKKVLVVHPFAKTIQSQYAQNRTRLFSNPKVLPEFELTTLSPPQSSAGSDCGFATWFDALSETCEQISRESYDVAVIGAGAYGAPIAAFVKSQGRQAVHIGGATQLLFGIKGRRWESEAEIEPMINRHWVRPAPEETPDGASVVEGGCYW